eukprot:gene15805-15833_t
MSQGVVVVGPEPSPAAGDQDAMVPRGAAPMAPSAPMMPTVASCPQPTASEPAAVPPAPVVVAAVVLPAAVMYQRLFGLTGPFKQYG